MGRAAARHTTLTVLTCRITLGPGAADYAAAEAALAVRVQDWLNGDEAHRGAKDSGDLGFLANARVAQG
jgi:hypothetical protein